MYIIGFNGPPGSGKDTLAKMVGDIIESNSDVAIKYESLSYPLRSIAYAMTGWTGELDGPDYDAFKNEVFIAFGNRTGRQLMIDVSEKFLKTEYGITIMALMLIERNLNFSGVLLVRDSGFQIEVDPLVDWVGAANLAIVQCKRPGHSFGGDSREWVFPPLGRKFFIANNNAGLTNLQIEAEEIFADLRRAPFNWNF